jgi:hypothetical protein
MYYVYIFHGGVMIADLGEFNYTDACMVAEGTAKKTLSIASVIVMDIKGNNKVEYVGRIMIDTDN